MFFRIRLFKPPCFYHNKVRWAARVYFSGYHGRHKFQIFSWGAELLKDARLTIECNVKVPAKSTTSVVLFSTDGC